MPDRSCFRGFEAESLAATYCERSSPVDGIVPCAYATTLVDLRHAPNYLPYVIVDLVGACICTHQHPLWMVFLLCAELSQSLYFVQK